MSQERNLRLVCACGRALADVFPPLFDVQITDRDKVALQVKGRSAAHMASTFLRPEGQQTTQWYIAHPEALQNWTFSWVCKCGRNPTLKEATIRSWWVEIDAKTYPNPWRVDHVLNM